MIFFDNASTTKIFDKAAKKIQQAMSEYYFNPSALYFQGLKVKNLLEDSRQVVANQLGAEKNEIYFTSCATESNNWVLNNGFKNKKGNLVISKGEHASVYECAMALKAKGYDVRFVELLNDGTLDLDDLMTKIDGGTSLASIIHCSNETGAINDISKISALIKSKSPNALIHSDGVQAFVKLKTNMANLGVDFYTVSAHKIGGPKGCGALYINKKCNIQPFIIGGGQENGLRSGTENVPAIIGFKEAISCFGELYDSLKIKSIFNYIFDRMTGDGWIYNGSKNNSGFILSFCMQGIRSEILQHLLSDEGILIGLGSACSSKTSENRVLSALGRNKSQIEGSIRLSIGLDTTLEEANTVCDNIFKNLSKIRKK